MNFMLLSVFGLGPVEFLIVIIFVVALAMIPKVFYLLTLQKALEQVELERRVMPKGQVWLELIPIFNMVWQFFNVNNVTKSLENEFHFRGMASQEITSAATLGKTFCILSCCSLIPLVGGFAGLGSFVCWIIFWIKISNFKKQLEDYQLHKIEYIK